VNSGAGFYRPDAKLIAQNAEWKLHTYQLLLLLHSFNSLFFQDNLGKPAPEKHNHSGKTNLDLLEQELLSGSGTSWVICKSAPRSRQITMPAPHHSVFYRPDALPVTQPTASHTSNIAYNITNLMSPRNPTWYDIRDSMMATSTEHCGGQSTAPDSGSATRSSTASHHPLLVTDQCSGCIYNHINRSA